MRYIRVQGKGFVSTTPDRTVLSFSLESSSNNYAQCLDELNKRTGIIRAGLKSSGAAQYDLTTTNFSVEVKQRQDGSQYVFDGYRASHRLRIEIPVDKDLLNNILARLAIGNSGAAVRISFTVKDRDALRQAVLAEAVRVAKRSAETLARAAGISIGRLHAIDYGWSEVHMYERDYDTISADGAPEVYADIDPEDVQADDIVTLTFEIDA